MIKHVFTGILFGTLFCLAGCASGSSENARNFSSPVPSAPGGQDEQPVPSTPGGTAPQANYDYVFTFQQWTNSSLDGSGQLFSIECHAIDAAGNVSQMIGCPVLEDENATGSNLVGVHARGDRLFVSTVPDQITTYSLAPQRVTKLFNGSFTVGSGDRHGLRGLNSDSLGSTLYGWAGGTQVVSFAVERSGRFSQLALPDLQLEMGMAQGNTIEIAPDGRMALLGIGYMYPHAGGTSDGIYPAMRDPDTGALSAPRPPHFSGLTLDGAFLGSKYYLVVGTNRMPAPGTFGPGLYRISPDSSFTQVASVLSDYLQVRAHPSGRFVYAWKAFDRDSGSLDTFEVDESSMTLRMTAQLAINGSDANYNNSDTYRIAWKVSETGRFMFTGAPDTHYATSSSFSVYTIDEQDGAPRLLKTVPLGSKVFEFQTGSGS